MGDRDAPLRVPTSYIACRDGRLNISSCAPRCVAYAHLALCQLSRYKGTAILRVAERLWKLLVVIGSYWRLLVESGQT